jgi:hypothetical protein
MFWRPGELCESKDLEWLKVRNHHGNVSCIWHIIATNTVEPRYFELTYSTTTTYTKGGGGEMDTSKSYEFNLVIVFLAVKMNSCVTWYNVGFEDLTAVVVKSGI